MKNKCEGCGGDCRFDPQSQELKCKYCGSLKHIEKENVKNTKTFLNESSTLSSNEVKEHVMFCKTCKNACVLSFDINNDDINIKSVYENIIIPGIKLFT